MGKAGVGGEWCAPARQTAELQIGAAHHLVTDEDRAARVEAFDLAGERPQAGSGRQHERQGDGEARERVQRRRCAGVRI